MHLLKEEEASRRCHICQPPPAPQKPFLQKNIEISSRIRRKLNFDFCADDEELQVKKLRINLSIPVVVDHQSKNTEAIKHSPSTTTSSTERSDSQKQNGEITNSGNSSTDLDTSIFSTPDQTERTGVKSTSPVDH